MFLKFLSHENLSPIFHLTLLYVTHFSPHLLQQKDFRTSGQRAVSAGINSRSIQGCSFFPFPTTTNWQQCNSRHIILVCCRLSTVLGFSFNNLSCGSQLKQLEVDEHRVYFLSNITSNLLHVCIARLTPTPPSAIYIYVVDCLAGRISQWEFVITNEISIFWFDVTSYRNDTPIDIFTKPVNFVLSGPL